MVNTLFAQPLRAKIKGVADLQQPRTEGQLRRFLGMINFYCRFITHCSPVAASPTPLTGGPNGPIEMSNKQLLEFQRLRASQAHATTLVDNLPIVLSGIRTAFRPDINSCADLLSGYAKN